MLKGRESLEKIAKVYTVSVKHIRNIKGGIKWIHITGGTVI